MSTADESTDELPLQPAALPLDPDVITDLVDPPLRRDPASAIETIVDGMGQWLFLKETLERNLSVPLSRRLESVRASPLLVYECARAWGGISYGVTGDELWAEDTVRDVRAVGTRRIELNRCGCPVANLVRQVLPAYLVIDATATARDLIVSAFEFNEEEIALELRDTLERRALQLDTGGASLAPLGEGLDGRAAAATFAYLNSLPSEWELDYDKAEADLVNFPGW